MRQVARLAVVALTVLGAAAASYADNPAAPALLEPTGGYGPHPAGTDLADTRKHVISAALGEVGKVSDIGGQNGDKLGWETLKSYFDEASDWGPNCFALGAAVENGVKLAGRNPPGGEWCGIFGTWCFVQSGVTAKWRFGVGPVPLTAHYDTKNIAPGDIGVIAEYVHHFVVVSRDGDSITTVSGNSTNRGITLDSPRKVSSLVYYYSPCAEVWVAQAPGAVAPATSLTSPAAPAAASEPVCMRGSTGAAVRRLQGDLVSLGYAIAIDGDFGPATERAVRELQQAKGCTVDGIVGPQTWAALEP